MTFRQFVFKNVIRNKRTYAAYFFSSSFSVLIFFVYALFIFHPDIKKGVTAAVAAQLMIAAEVLMYVFSFLFVLYSVSTFLKSRKREFGILMMHGMTRKQLNTMVFLENMLIGLASIMVGIVTGIITGKLFLMIGSNMIGIDTLSFYLSPKALILTICAFVILFFCISLITTILVRVNKLIDLFQAGEKPKKEPKASILLSLLSAILLITSYFLAATTTMQTILIRILPVIGMTVVGTYFFYTQLSVFLVKMLQKNRLLFWKRTNIVTISSLAYRLKDNARMFFMVTIVSTVSFCAVGTLASMNAMVKQFKVNYPAAISYFAMDTNPIHQQNLLQIESELKEKKIDYKIKQVLIKYVEVASTSESSRPNEMAVISFSDYKKIAKAAGYHFSEKPLSENETLSMLMSQFENSYEKGDEKPITYTLKQEDIKLTPNKTSKNVAFPSRMGLIVSDELFSKLTAVSTETFTGFFTNDFEKTAGMMKSLTKNGYAFVMDNHHYDMIVSGTLYKNQMNMYRTMLFVALLTGAVFFIAAGSFLYFRLYADLDYDRRHFLTIKKIGLTDQELKKIVTRQLVLLFFVPIIIAFVHCGFAFQALQSYYSVSIAPEMFVVLGSFLLAQIIYFCFIRHRYLLNLKKSLI